MENITKTILGRTNFLISRVVYGGIISMDESQQDSDSYVAEAIDRGVNYFDVAPTYGDAQLKLGNSLKSYRKNVFLACKTELRDASGAETSIRDSMKLLHTDYFDIFQLHALTTPEDLDQVFAKDGAMNYLVKARDKGLIRNIGFSAHNEEVALKALSLFDFDTTLYPINWALGYKKSMGVELVKKAKENNMGILALKSLALRQWKKDEDVIFPKCWYKPIDTGSSLAKAALKYTLSQGAHTIVPPGYYSYFKFVLDNIDECIKNPLDDDDRMLISRALIELHDDLIF